MARRPSTSRLSSHLREPDGAGGPERSAPAGLSSGALGYGSGGPTYLDANHQKRPPTPVELVNAYKSIAFACIGLNAKGGAKVPLRLYAVRRSGMAAPRRSFRRAGDAAQRRIRGTDRYGNPDPRAALSGLSRAIDTNDEIDEVLDHQLLGAVAKPNPYFDRETLLQYLFASLDATGAAYLYPERPPGPDGYGDTSWASRQVWPLQSQYVYPVKGIGTELIRNWRYFGDTFGPSELVRVRWMSLRDPYLSQAAPLHACYEQSSLVDYYTATVEAILDGGARPEVVIGAKDGAFRWGETERERFEDDVNSRFSRSRAGRAWVVDGSFDVKTLSHSPVDLGGLELTKTQRLLVANCFDTPISLLQSEDSNKATAQESTHQHQYYAIDPRCRMVAAALTCQWAQPVDERLFFFFDDPVTRDTEQEARVWAMRVEKSQMTPDEWRANDGLPPAEGGDALLVSTSLVPLASLSAPAPADGKPADPAVVGDDVDVQGQALNGAQISSLVEVIQNVRDGVIPPESAKALLAAAFPALSPETIDRIVSPVEVKESAAAPPPGPIPPPIAAAEPPPKPPPAERSSPDLDAQLARVLDLLEGKLTRAEPDHHEPEAEADGGPDGIRGLDGALPE